MVALVQANHLLSQPHRPPCFLFIKPRTEWATKFCIIISWVVITQCYITNYPHAGNLLTKKPLLYWTVPLNWEREQACLGLVQCLLRLQSRCLGLWSPRRLEHLPPRQSLTRVLEGFLLSAGNMSKLINRRDLSWCFPHILAFDFPLNHWSKKE